MSLSLSQRRMAVVSIEATAFFLKKDIEISEIWQVKRTKGETIFQED